MLENIKYKILVTGGSGFLGSHVADALSAAGHQVTIFDLLPSTYLKQDQQMIVGDILDEAALERAAKDMDFIYHFAAVADIDVAKNTPKQTLQVNLLGTINVLEAARKNNVHKMIFASSIYVNSRTGSFYRVSKHACELLMEEYQRRFQLPFTILRFGTLYGTRADQHNSVYRYLKQALETKRIEFYGTGEEVREFIHAVDAAKICVRILQPIYDNETYIITGHHRLTVPEFLQMIKEILNHQVEIIHHPQESISHYHQTPYSYIPRVGKKIVMDIYCDLGQSIVEILHEIDNHKEPEVIQLTTR